MPHTPLRSPKLQSLPSTLASLLKFPPHDGQIEAIRSLVFDQLDLIVIVSTGWGKSAIFQAIPALRGGICLMITDSRYLARADATRGGVGHVVRLDPVTGVPSLLK
jgi:hypothetical protein